MAAKKKSAKKSVKSAKKPVRRHQLKKLVIDRQKWLRGTGTGYGKLLDNEGKMCCLGFAARACGVPANSIKNRLMPLDLTPLQQKKMPKAFLEATESKSEGLSAVASDWNDNDQINCDDREERLTKLFGDAGIELSFIN